MSAHHHHEEREMKQQPTKKVTEQTTARVNAQLIYQHLQQHIEQLQTIDEKIGELGQLIEALTNLNTQDKKMLATLGGGIFLDATLHDTTNLYVNVGAGVIVKKKASDVKNILEGQLIELQSTKQQLINQAEHLQHQLLNAQESLKE